MGIRCYLCSERATQRQLEHLFEDSATPCQPALQSACAVIRRTPCGAQVDASGFLMRLLDAVLRDLPAS